MTEIEIHVANALRGAPAYFDLETLAAGGERDRERLLDAAVSELPTQES